MTDEMMHDLDAALAVDDDMQKEIDTLKADPWELLPNREGFCPLGLDENAEEGTELYDQGYRTKWTQGEVVEIEKAGVRPLQNRDNPDTIEGQIVFIQYKSVRGKNEGKRIEQSWWIRNGERDKAIEMNGALQEICGRLEIEPVMIPTEDGEKPSYTAALPNLNGKTVEMTLHQKWDYPYKLINGEWEVQSEEPKKFKKRIFGIKKI